MNKTQAQARYSELMEGAETMDKDVTEHIMYDWSDGEALPILRCICGQTFAYWEHYISIYRDNATECPSCGRRLYWQPSITIYEVVEDE